MSAYPNNYLIEYTRHVLDDRDALPTENWNQIMFITQNVLPTNPYPPEAEDITAPPRHGRIAVHKMFIIINSLFLFYTVNEDTHKVLITAIIHRDTAR